MKQAVSYDIAKKHYGVSPVRIGILILYALIIFFLLIQSPWAGTKIRRYEGTQNYMEDSWVFRRGDTVLEEALEVPAFRYLQTGSHYSVSTTLTYDGSRDDVPMCFFFVDHIHCRVLLNGEELFSYMPGDVQKPDRSRSPGNVYVSVQLPRDCQGKELVIEFVPALSDSIEYQLPCPSFGDYATTAIHTFRADLPHNLMVVLSAILGVTSVIFSTLMLPGTKYREGLFIGLFATFFSLYGMTESDFDFYAISNPYYTYFIDYVSFSLMPIFLMAFLRERVNQRYKKCTLWIILLCIGMVITELILHLTGRMDMREFLPILHMVFAGAFLIIFILLVTMKQDRKKKHLAIQMIPILVGLILDGSVYYLHWQLGTSDSTFTSLGVVFFLIAELYHVWQYSIVVYTESVRSQDYMKMAYVDALTGIGNRRAFEAEKNAIAEGRRDFRQLILASADLNNLKITNDTLGHAAGDFLIRSAAQVLSELTENRCHAFRMGGDEFLVLIYDLDGPEFENCIRRMEEKIKAVNSNSKAKLSIAVDFQISRGIDLDHDIKLADQKMYRRKAEMKQAQN